MQFLAIFTDFHAVFMLMCDTPWKILISNTFNILCGFHHNSAHWENLRISQKYFPTLKPPRNFPTLNPSAMPQCSTVPQKCSAVQMNCSAVLWQTCSNVPWKSSSVSHNCPGRLRKCSVVPRKCSTDIVLK